MSKIAEGFPSKLTFIYVSGCDILPPVLGSFPNSAGTMVYSFFPILPYLIYCLLKADHAVNACTARRTLQIVGTVGYLMYARDHNLGPTFLLFAMISA